MTTQEQEVVSQQNSTEASLDTSNTGNNIWQETESTGGEQQTSVQQTNSGSTETSNQQTQQSAATQTEPKPVLLTKDALQEMLSKMTPQQQAVQQTQQQPQMSVEELNKMLNVFQVTPEIVQKLGLTAESAPVLHDALQAVARQAVTMASYQMQLKMQEMMSQITPLQQIVQAQQEQVYRQEFFEKHPDLKDYGPLLEAVYTQLKTEGYRGNSKTEVFEKISSRAKELLAKLPKAAAGNGTAQTTAPVKRMSTLSSGGQGGVGNNGGSSEPKSTAKSLFGR